MLAFSLKCLAKIKTSPPVNSKICLDKIEPDEISSFKVNWD